MEEFFLSKVKDILEKNNLIREYNITENNIIKSITCDSRNVSKNSLFFCKGKNYKEEYLNDAIKKGTICYISEIYYEQTEISYFIVTDILKAMAIISSEFYGNPAKDLKLIGITGTKGKTTTTYFLKNILENFVEDEVGFISSIEINTGIRKEESHLTTPESIEIYKDFKEIKDAKLKYTVIEVSSQSYKRDRLFGVDFEYGIFTNIAEDHISKIEHPTFKDYLNCKIEFLKHCKTIVINKNTDYLEYILSKIKNKNIVLYGTDRSADFYVKDIEKDGSGFKFYVVNEKEKYSHAFKINMAGRFNIENATAAIVIAKLNNIDDKIIEKALEETSVEGRMNIYEKKGITVIVDYAHNGYSFSKLFESIKVDYPDRKIISVGGIVGGKAYNRRKEFGEIVGANSDYIYLTSDNPQFESVYDICMDIAKYIKQKDKFEIIENRKEAINKAIMNASDGDIVVLLAKGGEKYIQINNENVEYEGDLEIAKQALKKKSENKKQLSYK